ncbi:MAG: RNA methyltransferase [Nitrospirae bacterium]|nr:RNA methyltransferase [Nitrospirota bacterium]
MKYKIITSSTNQAIKEAVRIKERDERPGHDAFMLEGRHLLEAAVISPSVEIKSVFFTKDFASKTKGQELLLKIQRKMIEQKTGYSAEVSGNVFSKLSETITPQGIAAIASYKCPALNQIAFRDMPLLAICDGIQDPGNLGTIIRAADAVGADAVITLPGTCDAFAQKTIRATAGSLFNIAVVDTDYESLLNYLSVENIHLFVTDAKAGDLLFGADLKRPAAIVFGNESHGVSGRIREKADSLIRIPIIGIAESLNAAMAASVCLYEALRRRRFSP